jgi:hypothetical protein
MNPFLKFLETKGITLEAFKALEIEKQADIQNEYLGSIEKQLEGLASKDELAKKENELKDFLAKEVSNQLLEQTSKGIEKVKSLEEEIKEKKEALLKVAKGETKEAVVLKADTNRASIPNNQQAVDLPNVGQLATRKLSLYDIFPKVRVSSSNHNGTIRYYDWDEATIARAAASVAEGATFPESTAKFKKGSVVIEKIGDTLPVTEEFFEDEAMFASELGLFLDTNVQLVVDNQLCNGTGASNTLVGLYQSAPAFTPASSGIADANIYDLIIKVAEDITTVGGSKYSPDTIIARKSVINQMKLKKDGENNYILPPFVSADGRNIDGMTVIESNIAPANTLVVCDKRFGRIYEMGGVELSTGLVGDQFIEDAMTLKARKRLAFLIREADKGGFRKVTNITNALATLATAP